ncbi:deleted in malignant brain tumors 1 protein-like isoform X8 [Onychostruthus taczanowskii]|uniref:deleted in malignant brain tumors 1 protein-like isoform X8 n=1 Tax=Onychostruthus taczanowskii TaxID=356909 RepID=UPI001B80CC02|nr:deleted in malignant brain tumors 1 protein-like isoform X8 [Onychostruthus taczanowskii]
MQEGPPPGQVLWGGCLPPGASGCRPPVARCVTAEAQARLIFGHGAGYWRPRPRRREMRRLIKAAAPVLLRAGARALARGGPAARARGRWPWGRCWRWGCSCACGCVRVRVGGAGGGPGRRRARLSSLRAAGSGQLRLVGGGGRCAGRVEVKHGGEWGSVCVFDFDWEARWAAVVCRQLGCGRVARASLHAPFGRGSGRIWLQPFCNGTEEELEQCPHVGWGRHLCGHERDVGVTCTDAVELRLAGGGSPCAGRVEVKLQGHWGSVADDNWDMEDAEVVCQQLGCGSASRAYSILKPFGAGDGLVSLALVDCSGDEATLWDCKIRGWGPYNSSFHHREAALVCQGFSQLVGGDGACAGWLEVHQGRAWVGVCEDQVDMKVAQVVCRELGCGEVIAIPGSGRFGAASGSLWDGGFQCNGTEPLLSACARGPPHGQACSGPGGVICSSYTGFRLGNGSSGCSGRVEVAVRGTWGSVCASEWDLPDAHVLCRQLGCGRAFSVPPGGSFGSGEGPLRPDAFGCSGSERHPGECPVAVLGKPPCAPGNAAAVVCSGTVESPRLVEGETRCEGFLESSTSTGHWRRVPGEVLFLRNLSNVCWKLGCGGLEKSGAVLGNVSMWDLNEAQWAIMKEVIETIKGMTTDLTNRTIPEEYFWSIYRGMKTAPAGISHGLDIVCSGVPRRRAPAVALGTVPVPTVLCVVLGTLLCLALGALALLLCRARARRRGPGRAADAVSNAVYEELDYKAMPEYQEVPTAPGGCSPCAPAVPGVKALPGSPRAAAAPGGPAAAPGHGLWVSLAPRAALLCSVRFCHRRCHSRPPPSPCLCPAGSLLEGWVKKLPYSSGDSVEGSDTEAAPDPPAWREQGTPDGYDDVLDVPQEPPAASSGDISEGAARQSWVCFLPTGERAPSCPVPSAESLHGRLWLWGQAGPQQQIHGCCGQSPGGVCQRDTELPAPSGPFLCCPQFGIYDPPNPPAATGDPSEQLPEHMDYDDVGSSALGTLP